MTRSVGLRRSSGSKLNDELTRKDYSSWDPSEGPGVWGQVSPEREETRVSLPYGSVPESLNPPYS